LKEHFSLLLQEGNELKSQELFSFAGRSLNRSQEVESHQGKFGLIRTRLYLLPQGLHFFGTYFRNLAKFSHGKGKLLGKGTYLQVISGISGKTFSPAPPPDYLLCRL